MKRITVAILAILTVLALLNAGCGAAATSTPKATSPSQATAAVLSISGAVEKPMSWSLTEIKSQGVVTLELNHPKKGKGTYEGVRLAALIAAAKPTASAKTVTFSASDAFKTDLALADVLKCADCLLTIDGAGALGTAIPYSVEGAAWVRDLVKIEVK
jgi:DMSO/TMAO reductase YedYZ molybdopterin-dependent catalytic subunit